MFTRQTYIFSLALLLSSTSMLTGIPADASQNDPFNANWLQLAEASPTITKGQAARAAQRKHGGKVLSVARKGSHYRVKLLKDSGKVVIVVVDGNTGKVK